MITEITVPQETQPVYNPIAFIVSSDNVGECSFKFIGDLYVNGLFKIRMFAFPEGPNDYGVFRVDRYLQDYISFDLKKDTVGFETNPNSIVAYYIEYREEFDTNSPCTGATTVTALLDTSNEFFAWNGALQYNEFPFYDLDNYQMVTGSSKFLSKIPYNSQIGPDDDFNLNFLQFETEEVEYLSVETFDINGNSIQTCQFANSISTANSYEKKLLSVGVGPKNLNAATLTAGSQPVIYEDVYYYEVCLLEGGNRVSEFKRFKIDYSCTKFETKRLWWLCRLGGFDSYSFKLKSFRKLDIQRTEYDKMLPYLSGTSYGYSIGDRGKTTLAVSGIEKFTYNTNWLSEDEGIWLEDLWTSPEVYLLKVEDATVYTISSAVYAGGFANLELNSGILLDVGTIFIYEVVNGSAIGMPDYGIGTITGFHGGTLRHTTNIVATINVGALITGTLMPYVKSLYPLNVKSTTWEEKLKSNKKRIQYSIELSPSTDVNIQR